MLYVIFPPSVRCLSEAVRISILCLFLTIPNLQEKYKIVSSTIDSFLYIMFIAEHNKSVSGQAFLSNKQHMALLCLHS